MVESNGEDDLIDAVGGGQPFLDDAARKSSVGRWQHACLTWQEGKDKGEAEAIMKQEAPSAISEAMQNRWFEVVEQIYQWLVTYAQEVIEKNPSLEVFYFRSLKQSGRAPDALRFGGELFKKRVNNISHIKGRLELLNRQKQDETARILAEEDFDFDRKIEQLERLDLLEPDEAIEMQERQDESELQTLVGRKIKSWLIRQWIFFFRQLHEIMDLNLKASYDLQGVESLPYLLSWKEQFSEAYKWFCNITKPLREGQEVAWLAELTILELELQMWECRLDSRKWFFAPDASSRREEAMALSRKCEVRREHLANIVMKVAPQLNPEDQAIAARIKNDPRVTTVLIGLDRILAAMETRSYEFDFDMDDEALAILGVHEHPTIQYRIAQGVKRFQDILPLVEKLLEDKRLDDATRTYLEEQRTGIMSQVTEHAPKLGHYVVGFEWYQATLQTADSINNNHLKSLAMNAFTFENLLGIARRLMSGHGGEELLEEAKTLCQKFNTDFPIASADPFLYASFLLQIGLAIQQEALGLDKDPGQIRHIHETMIEVLLSLLEIPDLPQVDRENWLNQAWDIAFGMVEATPRPDQKGLHGWAHYQMDALARCLSHTKKYASTFQSSEDPWAEVPGGLDLDFQPPIHIPLEAYETGQHLIEEELAKPRPDDFPPSYLLGLREKAKRLTALVKIVEEEKGEEPPPGEDERPDLKIVV